MSEQAVSRKRHRWRRFGLAVLLLGAGIGYWLLRPSDRLLDRATFIADTTHMGEGDRFDVGFGPFWDSDHSLIYDRKPIASDPEFARDCGHTAVRYDIRTRHETVLEHLTRNRAGFSPEVSDSGALSPDGKWLVMSERWGGCLLAEVDGPRRLEAKVSDGERYRCLFWTSDSRYWVEVFLSNDTAANLVIHSVSAPSVGPKQVRVAFAGLDNQRSIAGLGATPGPSNAVSAVVNYYEDASYANTAVVRHVSLFNASESSLANDITIPVEGDICRFYVSSDGRRIAWVVAVRTKSRFLSFIHRIIRAVPEPDGTDLQLWVSQADGSGMRLLGARRSEGVKGEAGFYPNEFVKVTWLPGGHKLGFEADEKLYTIDAD